jgi:hypothetical protein
MAYADIPPQRMSAATSFSSMMQQFSNGMGVALGALLLQVVVMARGAAGAVPAAGDYRAAFVAAGVLALVSIPFFLRLAPGAGAEVSGHSLGSRRGAKRIAESGD